MVARTTPARVGCVLAALLLPLGCSALLGIEDATPIDEDDGAGGSGGAGGGSGGSGGVTGGGGSAGGGATLCETYCETVNTHCTDELEVYQNDAICLALCQTMEEGEPDDSDVDTVHCRLNQAIAADTTGEPEEHCPFAGLGGGEVCGNNCDALCRAMLEVCPDEWASNTACLEDCDGLEDLLGYNTTLNSGATVQCRTWHVGAATQAQTPHCGHAAGASPCAPGDG